MKFNNTPIGSRVFAISHNDEKNTYLFGFGVYEGDTLPLDKSDIAEARAATLKKTDTLLRAAVAEDGLAVADEGKFAKAVLREAENIGNPRIRLDDGRYVWGCECWWGPEEDMLKQDLNIVNVDIDEYREQAKRESGKNTGREEVAS